jgi:iron complex transport system permease protein
MSKNLTILLLLIVFVIVFGLALFGGAVNMDFSQLSETDWDILRYSRLPRVLLAGLVGASLSLSGVLFQYVMKNPLADSFTTGASASSAMGAVVAILFGIGFLIPVLALIGGVIGLTVVYKVSSVKGRVQPITMLLAGIVVSTFASSIISLMKYIADDSVASIIFWLMGGFQDASMQQVTILTIVLVVAWIAIRKNYLSLDIICFDDSTAMASGVDVHPLRKKIFFIAALLTAICVGYAGIIGFVGLIIPHMVRLFKFVVASELIPISMLFGAIFMILNDYLARVILTDGQELSVGILTSAIGGAFFLYLLMKRKKELYYFD